MHEDTFFYCVNNPTSYSSYIYKKNVLSLKDLCHETCYLDNIFLLKFPILRSYLNPKKLQQTQYFFNFAVKYSSPYSDLFLSRFFVKGLDGIDWLIGNNPRKSRVPVWAAQPRSTPCPGWCMQCWPPPPGTPWAPSLQHSVWSYTVRKFNWWHYCLAPCDEMFGHILHLTELYVT